MGVVADILASSLGCKYSYVFGTQLLSWQGTVFSSQVPLSVLYLTVNVFPFSNCYDSMGCQNTEHINPTLRGLVFFVENGH